MNTKPTPADIRRAIDAGDYGHASYLSLQLEEHHTGESIKAEYIRFQDFAIGLATGVVITALVLGMVFL